MSTAGSAPGAVSLQIPVRRFDLDLAVRSHGWYDLPPFSWDSEAGRLAFVFLEGERVVAVEVTKRKGKLLVKASDAGGKTSFSYAAAASAAADRRKRALGWPESRARFARRAAVADP